MYEPLREASCNQITGVTVVAIEVTEQVLARRTDEAAADLRLLAAHAPAFLFRTDAAGRITYVNDSLFG